MTPECQPLDILVNKKFKDNIKYLFEENRLFFNNLNPKIKLNTARINLINYIYKVWYDPAIITKDDIKRGFEYAGIIGNYYTSKEEDNINSGYLYDLIENDNLEILDDLGSYLNLTEKDVENESDNEEKEKKDKFKNLLNDKNIINNISNEEQLKENKPTSDYKGGNINFNEIKNDIDIFNSVYSKNNNNNINTEIENIIKKEDNMSLDIDE